MAIKKRFIKVEIPLIEENVMILGTPETANNKTIKLDLSRKLRGRSLEATFVLINAKEQLTGYPKKLELMKQYILRMMRKRANYVEDSFEAQCKDISCTVKPFLITRKKVSRAIRNNLRTTAREFIIEYTKNKNYLEVCERTFYMELQKEMLPKLKKVYPLSMCEIRVIETKNLKKADFTEEKKIRREEKITEEPAETKEMQPKLEQSEEETPGEETEEEKSVQEA
jgi:ribosomal protein S3AE